MPLVLLRQQPSLAIRLSNVVSFVVLFMAGYRWGRYTGANPWKIGLMLIEFPGNQFKGEIVPALIELTERGTIRILDLLFIKKDGDGHVEAAFAAAQLA